MRRKNDWIFCVIVIVCIVMLGVIFDTWPLYAACQNMRRELRERANMLQQLQLSESRYAMTRMSKKQLSSSLLQRMTDIEHRAGISLIAFVHLPFDDSRGNIGDHASCVMAGTFEQMIAAMLELTNASNGLLLREFTLQPTDNGDYILKADIFLLNAIQAIQQTKSVNQIKNPFCAGSDGQSVLQAENETVLHHVSVKTMQMIAFLRQGNSAVAWLRLSNGYVAQVKCGDVIGREDAVVVRINNNEMDLSVGNGDSYQLTMMEIKN